jgi:hypothetical protein
MTVIPTRTPRQQMGQTIRLIGDAIKRGETNLKIRNLAASWASQAPAKNYLRQANNVYNGFLQHWRYVKDPVRAELLTLSPDAAFSLTMAGDGRGVGLGVGAGDCDCATIALGMALESIGLPVRLVTIANPNKPPGHLMDHIYPEVYITKMGWIPADPVLYPRGGFGEEPPYSRKVIYDLDGRVVHYEGNLTGALGDDMTTPYIWNRPEWRTYGGLLGGEPVADYSGAFFGAEGDGQPLWDFETVGLAGFGYLSPQMGMMEGLGHVAEVADVDENEPFWNGLALTPMMELRPEDYQYMQINGIPYEGMPALSQDGEPYTWEGLGAFGGWFKRLARRIKKGFKKIGRKVRKVVKKVRGGFRKVLKKGFKVFRKIGGRIRKYARKIIKKLPGGKALVKIAGKIRKVAMKVVRPVSKFVGKYASKIAPIANFIPGYGPAIAAGLRIAGRVAKGFNTIDALRRGHVPGGLVKGRIPGLLGEPSEDSYAMQNGIADLYRRTGMY